MAPLSARFAAPNHRYTLEEIQLSRQFIGGLQCPYFYSFLTRNLYWQAFAEEVHDAFESGLANTRRKVAVSFKTKRVKRRREEQYEPGERVVEGYCKALQETLLVWGLLTDSKFECSLTW